MKRKQKECFSEMKKFHKEKLCVFLSVEKLKVVNSLIWTFVEFKLQCYVTQANCQ